MRKIYTKIKISIIDYIDVWKNLNLLSKQDKQMFIFSTIALSLNLIICILSIVNLYITIKK